MVQCHSRPGGKGNETWAADSWKYGGGAPWMTGSYDPELNLIYWGTSNTSSDFFGEDRKGDNLYTNSIVALKPATGELAWYSRPSRTMSGISMPSTSKSSWIYP